MIRQQIRDDIRAAVDSSSTFLITSATKPDGDSIASQLSLRILLLNYKGGNARVDIVNEVPCPRRYQFLLSAPDDLKTLDGVGGALLEKYDMAFTVDCSPERIGRIRPLYDTARVKVTIDHHKIATQAGADVYMVDPTAGSTAEMIYGFLVDPAWKTPLTPALAPILYTGMIFDSGGFLYKLTTPDTLRIAATLLETGFDFSVIAERVLLLKSYPARKLMGRIFTAMKTNRSGAIAYATVSQRMMLECDAHSDDLEGIVEQMIFTEGIEVAILAIDLAGSDEYKLSLRSRGKVDVAMLARKLDPQGGGHDRAAGCNLKGEAEEILWRVVGEVEDLLELKTNRTVGLRKA